MSAKTTKANETASIVEDATEQTAQAGAKAYDRTVAGIKESFNLAVPQIEKVQASVKDNLDRAVRTAEELVSFGQGNVEAAIRSSQILATGLQDITKQVAANAQAQLDETISTFRALTGAKSLKEAVDLQANLVRNTLEKTFSETGKLTDATFRLAEQAWAPLTQRVTAAVEKLGQKRA